MNCFVLRMMNQSLVEGCVPQSFKEAAIKPLINKSKLDASVLSSYRPVSNLPFLSKMLEKIVFRQLNDILQPSDLFEVLQSGFNTETALLKVSIDLLMAGLSTALFLFQFY